MKIILNILIIISFILPIAYFNLVYYITVYSVPEQEFFTKQNYFIEMYWILNHWASGEMGCFPIYPTIFGIGCLVIKKWIIK